MKKEYTKGDWRVELGINVISSNGRPICACGTFNPSESNFQDANKANAKLIAAAPELLEALVDIINTEKKYGIEIPVILHEPFRKAKQAIKKATK